MDKGSCFCIEGNELYLEQVLVDHNDIPIFFVCKDTMAYYVVLCSDIEELSYIVIEPSTLDLYRLLHGMLSMREVFTKQKNYWEIISGETIESDVVLCKPIQEIDHSVLPEEGACFEILTDEVSSYVISQMQGAEIYRITLIMNGNKPDEYSFEISLTGFFTIEDSQEITQRSKDDLISKNAVAILMPYLRSEVSLLTAQPGMECVVLPAFNINKLLEKSDGY